MKKKLYLVVEKQLEYVGDVQETNGFKYITAYEIINNELIKFISIETEIENESISAMLEYLEDNGYDFDFSFTII